MSKRLVGAQRAVVAAAAMVSTAVAVAGPAAAQPVDTPAPIGEILSNLDTSRIPAAGGLFSTGDGGIFNFGGSGGIGNFGGDGGIGNFGGDGGFMNFGGDGGFFNPGGCGGFFGIGGTGSSDCALPEPPICNPINPLSINAIPVSENAYTNLNFIGTDCPPPPPPPPPTIYTGSGYWGYTPLGSYGALPWGTDPTPDYCLVSPFGNFPGGTYFCFPQP